MTDFNIGDKVQVDENATCSYGFGMTESSDVAGMVGIIISGPDDEGDFDVEPLDNSYHDAVSPRFLRLYEEEEVITVKVSDLPYVKHGVNSLSAGSAYYSLGEDPDFQGLADLHYSYALESLAIHREFTRLSAEQSKGKEKEALEQIASAVEGMSGEFAERISKVLDEFQGR